MKALAHGSMLALAMFDATLSVLFLAHRKAIGSYADPVAVVFAAAFSYQISVLWPIRGDKFRRECD